MDSDRGSLSRRARSWFGVAFRGRLATSSDGPRTSQPPHVAQGASTSATGTRVSGALRPLTALNLRGDSRRSTDVLAGPPEFCAVRVEELLVVGEDEDRRAALQHRVLHLLWDRPAEIRFLDGYLERNLKGR
jgi:hypothetical protein